MLTPLLTWVKLGSLSKVCKEGILNLLMKWVEISSSLQIMGLVLPLNKLKWIRLGQTLWSLMEISTLTLQAKKLAEILSRQKHSSLVTTRNLIAIRIWRMSQTARGGTYMKIWIRLQWLFRIWTTRMRSQNCYWLQTLTLKSKLEGRYKIKNTLIS